MQVNFQHEAKTTGAIFTKVTHYLTVHATFTEEEVYLIEQTGIMDQLLFAAPQSNLLGRRVERDFAVRDLVAGPFVLEFPSLANANAAQEGITNDLRNLKDTIYGQNHDGNSSTSIEI